MTRLVSRSVDAVGRVNGLVERHGVRRGLEFAARARPGRSGTQTVEWQGYEAPFQLRLDGGSDIATFNEVIVDECYALPFETQLRTIVDAGANIGLTSAYFARRWPDAVIVAIEPDADNFDLLVANVAAYPNVQPIRAALWTEPGTVRLGDPRSGPRGYRVDEQASRGSTVPAVELSGVLADHGIDRLDLLKIDVEGAEVEVFGASEGWIDRVDAIAVELHDRIRPGCSRVFFRAVAEFPHEWSKGETTFVSRRA